MPRPVFLWAPPGVATPNLPGALRSGQCQQGQSAKGKRMGLLIFPESTTEAENFGYGGQLYKQSQILLQEQIINPERERSSPHIGLCGH